MLPVKEYFIEIPSDPNSLPDVEDLLLQIGKENNFEKIKFNNFILSVNEATTNAMLHGNHGQIEKKVRITLSVMESKIKAVIKDEGKGFDPTKVPDPTEPENLFKESGRGLYIMNTCMDSMTYNFTANGTELTLIMKF
jgi:serine/threonine-protein kinase RsbW